MKNLEKYLDVILDEDIDSINCTVCKLRLGYDPCKDDLSMSSTDCGAQCKRNKQWLKEEYVERTKLTMAEKAILENLPKEYEWISRDKDGELFLYYGYPSKKYDAWLCYEHDIGRSLTLFNHLFQFIKWEDEEPSHIPTLLINCEVID